MTATPTFPTLLQDFFHQHLLAQRQASPRTVASYRDAFRLLLTYAHDRLHKPPSAVTLADLDAPLLLAFLDHLEGTRHNGARTRNARLAALRSFLHYAAVRDPTALAVIQRALAIPTKRFDRPLLGFLSRAEIDALLAAPDRSTWSGHRDHVLFTTLYNTGARVSEIIGVRVADLVLEPVAHVRLHGKGRKDRTVPLVEEHGQAPEGVASPGEGGARHPALPQRPRCRTLAFGCRTPSPCRGHDRQRQLSLTRDPTDLAAYLSAHDGDAPAAIRRRPIGHRALARARKPRHHAPVCRG